MAVLSVRQKCAECLCIVLAFVWAMSAGGCRKDELILRRASDDTVVSPNLTDAADPGHPEDSTNPEVNRHPEDNTNLAADGKTAGSGKSENSGKTGNTGNVQAGTEKEKSFCAVFVCGAVRTPGVYYLTEGARAVDAVDAAGGFLPSADREYLNLASAVTDGQKLKIYTEEETMQIRAEAEASGQNRKMWEDPLTGNDAAYAAGSSTGSDITPAGMGETDSGTGMKTGSETGNDRLINLNTAGKEELMTLPGIGEARSLAIIAWREEHGSFADPHDICNIPGIGEALYGKISSLVKAE